MEKAGSTLQQEGKGATPSFRADPTAQDHQHRNTRSAAPAPTNSPDLKAEFLNQEIKNLN